MMIAATATRIGAAIEDVDFSFQKNRGQPVQSTRHGVESFPFIRCWIIAFVFYESSLA